METRGWNKTTKTGWLKKNGVWVQYRNGKPTGRTEKKGSDTNLVGKFVGDQKKFWSSNPRKDKLKAQQQREKAGFPDKSVLDSKPSDTSKVSRKSDSPQNLRKRFDKNTASETGPFGGKNPWKDKPAGEVFKNAPDLKIGTKYEGGKPSADTTSSKSKKETKQDKKRFPGGKDKYTNFEKAGARQSSARNSIARDAWKRKRDKLKAGK